MTLSTSLIHLESSELVRRVPGEELVYLFKHGLVQETASESLLKNERRRLNQRVAETLERLYADRLDEYAARLFQHYDAGGDRSKTIEYAERAGDVASRLSAYGEAIGAYARAFELARAQAGDTDRIVRLMIRLGRVYELDAKYDAAFLVYRETRDLARARMDRPLELAALTQLAKVLAVAAMRYDPTQAQEITRDALELARALEDRHAESRILWTMMLLNVYGAGGSRQGLRYGEQSLEIARGLNLREQMAYTLNDLFYTYFNLGESARAYACAVEARALWSELDNKPMLADIVNATGMWHTLQGNFQDALAFTREGRALSQSIGNRWGEATSYMVEGYTTFERGHIAEALENCEACLRTGEPIGMHGPLVMARYAEAQVYAFLGDGTRGLQVALDALERTRNLALDWNPWAYATLAYVEEQRGNPDGADDTLSRITDAPLEYHFERMLASGATLIAQTLARRDVRHGNTETARARLEELLARIRRSGFSIFVPATLNQLARVDLARGNCGDARAWLNQAQAEASALGLRRTSLEIAATRIELARTEGDSREAADARMGAHTAFDAFLPLIPAELRSSFLQTALAGELQNA